MSDAVHTFLPWARRGLASQIAEAEIYDGLTAPGGFGSTLLRGKIDTYVHINNGNIGSPIHVPLNIIGPGDIIGIQQDVVVKTEPHAWITNFEPRAFPYIDFYEEDFPWRYSPAKPLTGAASPTGKIRPWITLIVLKEDEFKRAEMKNAPLNSIELNQTTIPGNRPLPEVDELWAWAHVSVDKGLTGNLNDALNAAVEANPNIAISRMICPRKLEENTSYYAFLIPSYETGRLAGLGKTIPATIPAQKPAWNHSTAWPDPNADEPWLFPIYYEWYFRTGATGDFEYLVRQIKPKTPDLKMGRRMMDISSPGYGIFFTAGNPGSNQGTETLEGALRIPGFASPTFADFKPAYPPASYPLQPPRNAENALRDKIKDFVNLGEDMLVAPGSNSYYTNQGFPDPSEDQTLYIDPIVAPPLYGRWHALRSKADPTDGAINWINEVNLDPRYRLAAGLGADYVKSRQEYLMQLAWEQVGPIIAANTAARLAQLAQATADALHQRHINNQPIAQLLPMTRGVHSRIRTGSITLEQKALESSLPDSAPSSTFRKLSAPNGALSKRTNPTIYLPVNNVMEKMRIGGVKPVAAKGSPGNNAASFPLSSLTYAVSAIQTVNTNNVNFNITVPGGSTVSPSNTVAANFKAALAPYGNVFDGVNWPIPTAQPNLTTPVASITDSIDPRLTHTKSFYDGVFLSNQPANAPVPDVIVPVMTAPSFNLPMYESLRDLGVDYLIPNLNLLPQNSVTIFESNQKFVEAFMLGANYEMGRELLWREYPTDQRGTYFSHFWGGVDSGLSAEDTRDILSINEWPSMDELGTNNARGGTQGNPMVLALRGDFLKKFPNAVIYMMEAEWDPLFAQANYWEKPRKLKQNGVTKFPTFSAKVNPDVTFLGFDGLSPATARGNKVPNATPSDAGWFLVFQERPGELRFGLDFPQDPNNGPQLIATWNDLSWAEVGVNGGDYVDLNLLVPGFDTAAFNYSEKIPAENGTIVAWAQDSAAMAMILYQNPVMAAIHCYEMIP